MPHCRLSLKHEVSNTACKMQPVKALSAACSNLCGLMQLGDRSFAVAGPWLWNTTSGTPSAGR